MKRRGAMIAALGVCVAAVSVATVCAAPVDLMEALSRGLVTAEFRGAGDTGVTGTIVRQTPVPLEVTVGAGTVFRAQFGIGGGGGYQGISTFQDTSVDLTTFRIADVFVPGGCTNFGLKAPTQDVVMAPTPSPNEKMSKLAQAIVTQEPDRQVAQVALWAVANNIPKWAATRYAGRILGPGASKDEIEAHSAKLRTGAEALVKKAGLDPKRYKAFR